MGGYLVQMKRHKSNKDLMRGATLIEAAIGLPVILLLVFGIIQWGLILATRITLVNATATASRLVALGNPSHCCDVIADAASDAASPFLTLPSGACTATGGCSSCPSQGSTNTTVTCNYSMNLLVPFVVPGNVNGYLDLTSTAVSR